MSYDRHGDGFFQPSLSLFSNQKEYCKRLKSVPLQSSILSEDLDFMLLPNHSGMTETQHEILVQACKRVALSFMLEGSDYAACLLSEEEYDKAISVFSRKQYESKILQKVLDYFSMLLAISTNDGEKLPLYFYSDIMREYQNIEEELVNKEFAPLKKKITTIASGVKPACYIATRPYIPLREKYLPEAWNEYFRSKTGYDYNCQINGTRRNFSTLMYEEEDQMLISLWQKSLLDDFDFWESHEKFSVFSFLESVEKRNSRRHAEKIFDYMCSVLMKMPNIQFMMENNLPLYMADQSRLVAGLERQSHRFTFAALHPYCNNLSILDAQPLCVPMSNVGKEKLQIGEKLFLNWINEYNYPGDSQAVLDYLKNEVSRFANGETCKDDDIAVILDGSRFRYLSESMDRQVFTLYYPDCFVSENIWKRLYASAYAVTLLTEDRKRQFDYLNRIYIDLINKVEEKTGICTAQKTDFISRENEYRALKEKMTSFGIEISDKYKEAYIIALLDRETALLREAERFPEFEQLGDAVYGFAVAERLFYCPDHESDYARKIENYTCASAQVELSKHFGFDELYLHSGLSAKYERFGSLYYSCEAFEADEERQQNQNLEKYLADSLEMIIGVLCIDKGATNAIDFTKRLLEEHFTDDFAHPEIRDAQENREKFTDTDYWDRILPCVSECINGDNMYLLLAFNKLITALSLGTDDKAKRRYITLAHNSNLVFGKLQKWAFYDYLHRGFDYVLSEYSHIVLESYNKQQNH